MNILHARLAIPLSEDLPAVASGRFETGLVPPNAEGWKVIALGIVLVFLTALWTWMRLWSLRQVGRSFAVEDGLNLGAVFLFFGIVASDFVMVLVGGMGHHVDELQSWHVIRLMKAMYARQFLYVVTFALVELSVISMLMRIFVFSPRFRLAAIPMIILTITCALSTVMVYLLICRPIAVNWQMPQTIERACGGGKQAANMATGIVNIINELAVLVLPLPVIHKLVVGTRQKAIIVFVFIMGILSLGFGITRLFTVQSMDLSNIPYSEVRPTVYGTSEAGIAIIASSCPLLLPVFDRFLSIILAYGGSAWKNKSGKIMNASGRRRRNIRSSGFTQMKNQSREDLELGNYGAHRSKRATKVTVGRPPPSRDEHRIVVTNETIVIRAKGEL
ncbi:hypothetical protein GGR52DRAFT_590564 [Hypoxylon sp. FL1284]|nr:hypothetical protein GGR52DRAFT_590564 [Hypoxylon sp. FL1284]